MKSSKCRIFSLTVLIVYCFIIFSSSLFIIAHTDHDCTGDGCSVCTELAECHKLLHTSGMAAAGLILFILSLIAVSEAAHAVIKKQSEHTTLISLKVELLN